MCPVFALTLPCLKNGNGQREFDHAARSQAIMLKYFSVSVIAFSAAAPYNRKENGMQAANSEAKGAQRHAVLAANFEEHALASPSKVLDALCRAAKEQS